MILPLPLSSPAAEHFVVRTRDWHRDDRFIQVLSNAEALLLMPSRYACDACWLPSSHHYQSRDNTPSSENQDIMSTIARRNLDVVSIQSAFAFLCPLSPTNLEKDTTRPQHSQNGHHTDRDHHSIPYPHRREQWPQSAARKD